MVPLKMIVSPNIRQVWWLRRHKLGTALSKRLLERINVAALHFKKFCIAFEVQLLANILLQAACGTWVHRHCNSQQLVYLLILLQDELVYTRVPAFFEVMTAQCGRNINVLLGFLRTGQAEKGAVESRTKYNSKCTTSSVSICRHISIRDYYEIVSIFFHKQ